MRLITQIEQNRQLAQIRLFELEQELKTPKVAELTQVEMFELELKNYSDNCN